MDGAALSDKNDVTAIAAANRVYDSEFLINLEAVLNQICARFPDNIQAQNYLALLPFAKKLNNNSVIRDMREKWRQFTIAHKTEIALGNVPVICMLFEQSDIKEAQALGLHKILADPNVDEQSKTSLVMYMQVLTHLAHAGTPTDIGAPVFSGHLSAVNPIPPPVVSPSVAPVAAAVQQKPDMEKAMKTFLDSVPQLVKTFNKALEDTDGNNMFAQMAKQFINPQQLQPGVANNLAMNLMADKENASSVMQQVQSQMGSKSISADEIVAKLQKLERIEALRARKKKNHS